MRCSAQVTELFHCVVDHGSVSKWRASGTGLRPPKLGPGLCGKGQQRRHSIPISWGLQRASCLLVNISCKDEGYTSSAELRTVLVTKWNYIKGQRRIIEVWRDALQGVLWQEHVFQMLRLLIEWWNWWIGERISSERRKPSSLVTEFMDGVDYSVYQKDRRSEGFLWEADLEPELEGKYS